MVHKRVWLIGVWRKSKKGEYIFIGILCLYFIQHLISHLLLVGPALAEDEENEEDEEGRVGVWWCSERV